MSRPRTLGSWRMASLAASVLLVLAMAPTAYADHDGTAKLVKDINTAVDPEVTGGTLGSDPSHLIVAGGKLFFTAEGPGGRELYRSNGTAVGTKLLSIRAGSRGAQPLELTVLGSKVVFSANDGATGRELWISDGTTTGTRRVKDIRPGSRGSNPTSLERMGSKVYFSATDGTRGRELWVSDGTAAGTRRVRDIRAGSKGSDPQELTAIGTRLFFSALGERNLWISDGTSAGTRAFPNSASLSWVSQLTRAGSQLFFVGETRIDMYRSRTDLRVVRQGASRSIALLDADYENCPTVNYCHDTLDLIPVGNLLYVTGPTRRLWRTDGTRAGTIKLMNLMDCGAKPGRYNDCAFAGAFTNVSGKLFFVRPTYQFSVERDAHISHDDELWTSDGTIAGTKLVSVFDVPSSGGWNGPGASTALNGIFYFTAYDAEVGFELFRSDGTAAGTRLVHEINTTGFDGGWAFPRYITPLGSSLFMSADDGTHGNELWRVTP